MIVEEERVVGDLAVASTVSQCASRGTPCCVRSPASEALRLEGRVRIRRNRGGLACWDEAEVVEDHLCGTEAGLTPIQTLEMRVRSRPADPEGKTKRWARTASVGRVCLEALSAASVTRTGRGTSQVPGS